MCSYTQPTTQGPRRHWTGPSMGLQHPTTIVRVTTLKGVRYTQTHTPPSFVSIEYGKLSEIPPRALNYPASISPASTINIEKLRLTRLAFYILGA